MIGNHHITSRGPEIDSPSLPNLTPSCYATADVAANTNTIDILWPLGLQTC